MSSTAQAFIVASQRYIIYIGFIILIAGLLGHACNIFVFTRLKMFRSKPAAFYLIAESIVNLLQLLISFTSRIAINGFAYDLTQTSLVWCKLRQMITQTITLTSLSIICFASFDQYLSTSYHPYLQQMSTIRLARILISIATIVWILHAIPIGIFFRIQSMTGCNIYDPNIIIYATYVYYLTLTGVLPIIVSTLFSVLAYRNVRRIIRRQISVRRRKRDQQLTAMIIFRVGFLVVTTVPYILQRIYIFSVKINKNDVIHKAIVDLVGTVTISFFYLNYAGSFYLFLVSSARFRRQVRYAFVNKCWRICCKTTKTQRNRSSTISQYQ